MRRLAPFVLVALALVLSCSPVAPKAPPVVRLVDLYQPEDVDGGGPATARDLPRTEWRFDQPAPAAVPAKLSATRGWEAGPGVAGLAVKESHLVGRSTTDYPLIHVERKAGLDDPDILFAVEVRMRVSAGGNLSASSEGSEKLDLDKVLSGAKSFPWRTKIPIIPGSQFHTYTMQPPRPALSSSIRHVLLRPTDAAGATFEIESVRLIFRKEHLASVPPGVGWQGLSEIYRESLVARAPERIHMRVTLPQRPWLDLAVGTLENAPVTFRVDLKPVDGSAMRARSSEPALERTVTRPHRWEEAPVDLSAYAGREVELSLSLASGEPGALGFWGSPVIRSSAGPPPVAQGGQAHPQGVILIWADTLRRDHLGVYGYERDTSPVLRRMASEGTLFSDCVVNATWTKVSTPALMTSLYPASNGVAEFGDRLPSSATTLAEVYREAGYATLSLCSVLFTGRFTNLHQGFEVLHEDTSLPDQESSKTAREYVDRLLPWLESHRQVPFFVFLHVTDAHDPYKPYPPYDTMWADPKKAEEHERQVERARGFIADPLMKLFGMPTREELIKAGIEPDDYVRRDRDWYDGSIRGLDAEVGRLIERLRELGLDGRTLVLFTGDHGEEFLEHGRMFHGQSVYGELTNVPLILRWPGGLPAGATVPRRVQTIDLMPTLLELSGLAPPEGIQGRSLVPLLRRAAQESAARKSVAGPQAAEGDGGAAESADEEDHPVFVQKAETFEPGGAPPPREIESFAILEGRWKLIHNPKRAPGRPEFELYDLSDDRLNLHDLAGQHPDVVQRLSRDLERWHTLTMGARLKPDADAAQALSHDELERLRSLGYIQ